MINLEPPKVITIDDKEVTVADFSDTVKTAVAVRTAMVSELETYRLKVNAYERAIQSYDVDLFALIKKELEARATEKPENSTEVES